MAAEALEKIEQFIDRFVELGGQALVVGVAARLATPTEASELSEADQKRSVRPAVSSNWFAKSASPTT